MRLACNAFHVGLFIPLPDGVAGAAACLVALNHLGDHLGSKPRYGADCLPKDPLK